MMRTDSHTTVIATAAVVSPAWLPWFQEISDIAGVILPILGAVWLLVQIVRAIWAWPSRR